MAVDLETLAFDLFVVIHGRLGHAEYCTHEAFDDIPQRKQAWVEIARLFREFGREQWQDVDVEADKLARFVAGLPTQYFTVKDARELRECLYALRRARGGR